MLTSPPPQPWPGEPLSDSWRQDYETIRDVFQKVCFVNNMEIQPRLCAAEFARRAGLTRPIINLSPTAFTHMA